MQARANEIQKAERHPAACAANPATTEPSIWPLISANSSRPMATCLLFMS